MKALLAIIFLLASASIAEAQKTCTRVTATSQNCSVTFSWNASVVDANHDAPATYVVRRSDGGGAPAQIGAPLPATSLSLQNVFTDAGNVNHCYDVTAVNSIGSSPPAPAICWTTPAIVGFPPNAPTGNTLAAISKTELQASWSDNSTDETQFKIALTGTAPPTSLTKLLPPNTQSYTIGGLQKNKTFCSTVYAMNGNLQSLPSNQSCATTQK
jgi:hypothetical protein